ncbi:MAG: guanylate kinase [Proteobacteria bacterium]|nr:guanylate kinase [Pseudomonadota bacterium]
MSGRIYVISGPSGAGKSSLVQHLMQGVTGLGYSVSHTSRRPRGSEVDGVNYHFVDKATFKNMIEKGGFVEWAEVYQDYYGTSFSSLEGQRARGLDVIMDVDVQGAENVRRHFKESILIYILPPSLEALERRLKERATDDESAIGVRIEKALKEIKNCTWYDYIIFNEDLLKATEEVESVIISERCRTSHQLSKADRLFKVTSP